MGWKNVKEHYGIDGVVHIKQDEIWVGVDGLVTISLEGNLLKAERDYYGKSLHNAVTKMRSDPDKLRSLVITPDRFGPLTTIWTYDRNSIIEKRCEIVGWPNCCTDGELQCDNTHSVDREIVLQWAIESATARLEQCSRFMQQKSEELMTAQEHWREANHDLSLLRGR